MRMGAGTDQTLPVCLEHFVYISVENNTHGRKSKNYVYAVKHKSEQYPQDAELFSQY